MDYIQKLMDLAARNQQIKLLRARGWSAIAIAKKFNVTRQRIQQILAK